LHNDVNAYWDTALGPYAGYNCTGNNDLFVGSTAGKYQGSVNGVILFDVFDRGSALGDLTGAPLVIQAYMNSNYQTFNFNGSSASFASGGSTWAVLSALGNSLPGATTMGTVTDTNLTAPNFTNAAGGTLQLLGTNWTARMIGNVYSNDLHMNGVPSITVAKGANAALTTMPGTMVAVLPGSSDFSSTILLSNGGFTGTNTVMYAWFTNTFSTPFNNSNYTVNIIPIYLPGVATATTPATAIQSMIGNGVAVTNRTASSFTVISTSTETGLDANTVQALSVSVTPANY